VKQDMSGRKPITFVIAVNNRSVFEKNFLLSPCLEEAQNYQILVQEGFRSAAQAYNNGIDRAVNDLIIFCHQDILLPKLWLSQLECALRLLDVDDPNWGVLGSYGKSQDGRGWGHVYSSGLGEGHPFRGPRQCRRSTRLC
jgi:hypothetical protein